jgi:uncharacterized membrane protein YphA (DoxX/SURF4 family)
VALPATLAQIAIVVLVIAGLAKIRQPGPTSDTLRSVHLPATRWLVVAMGAFEVVLGVAAAITGNGLLLAAVAVCYLGFWMVTWAVGRSPAAPNSCGCFGATRAPLGRVHQVGNLVSAGVVALSATDPLSLGEVLGDTPAAGVPAVGLILLAAAMYIMVLTTLAELFASFEPKELAAPTLSLAPRSGDGR